MSDQQRQAALLLHGMSPQDRDWTLRALPAAQRQVLQDLLTDLRQMGIPADPSLLRQALAEAPQAAPAMNGSTDWQHSLQQWPLTRVAVIKAQLDYAPARLVAAILGQSDWPWRAALLAILSDTQRREVRDLQGEPVAPAMAVAACAALAHALQQTPLDRIEVNAAVVAEPAKTWRRWFAREGAQ